MADGMVSRCLLEIDGNHILFCHVVNANNVHYLCIKSSEFKVYVIVDNDLKMVVSCASAISAICAHADNKSVVLHIGLQDGLYSISLTQASDATNSEESPDIFRELLQDEGPVMKSSQARLSVSAEHRILSVSGIQDILVAEDIMAVLMKDTSAAATKLLLFRYSGFELNEPISWCWFPANKVELENPQVKLLHELRIPQVKRLYSAVNSSKSGKSQAHRVLSIGGSLFAHLFGNEAHLLNSPVFLVASAGRLYSFHSRLGHEPKLIYECQEEIVSLHVASGESGSDYLLVVGSQGRLAVFTCVEKGNMSVQECLLSGSVVCSYLHGSSLIHSSLSDVSWTDLSNVLQSRDQSSAVNSKAVLKSVSCGFRNIIFMVDTQDAVWQSSDYVELILLTHQGKVLLSKVQSSPTKCLSTSGPTRPEQLHDVLTSIKHTSEHRSRLQLMIHIQNRIYNQLCIASTAAARSNVQSVPITCSVHLKHNLKQFSVHTTLSNKTSHELLPGWSVVVEISTMDGDQSSRQIYTHSVGLLLSGSPFSIVDNVSERVLQQLSVQVSVYLVFSPVHCLSHLCSLNHLSIEDFPQTVYQTTVSLLLTEKSFDVFAFLSEHKAAESKTLFKFVESNACVSSKPDKVVSGSVVEELVAGINRSRRPGRELLCPSEQSRVSRTKEHTLSVQAEKQPDDGKGHTQEAAILRRLFKQNDAVRIRKNQHTVTLSTPSGVVLSVRCEGLTLHLSSTCRALLTRAAHAATTGHVEIGAGDQKISTASVRKALQALEKEQKNLQSCLEEAMSSTDCGEDELNEMFSLYTSLREKTRQMHSLCQ